MIINRTLHSYKNFFKWHLADSLFSRWTLIVLILVLSGCRSETGILNPKGIITYEQRQLLFDASALMLIVVIPVIIMSFAFVIRYHRTHSMSEYKPNWGHNAFFEAIWWGVPCIIILVLGIMTWIQTHKLDPYRPLDVPGQPMLIQAIALPWKWLFIYPEENVATVNYLVLPKERPVEFWLTVDNVPMSAFFIPQLSSQIYAMAGMRTRLHLLASEVGTFDGFNAQYNGNGFSDMHFVVQVVEPQAFSQWVNTIKQSGRTLTESEYQQLLNPSIAHPVQYYSSAPKDLFQTVIHLYMTPGVSSHPRTFNVRE